MELKNILLIVVVLILLYVVSKYLLKDSTTLTSTTNAQTSQTVSASSLSSSSSSNSSSNFSYSIWFYIEDWNYRYGEPKVIFGRGTAGALEPCPSVVLGASQNNLLVSLAVYADPAVTGTTNNDNSNPNTMIHTCTVANIPIQKWVNLTVSVYGRSLDIYIDGKLVRTCVLPGVAYVDTNANVLITPNGGFSGWTSKFQYWDHSADPQSAWNTYQKGFGGSLLGNTVGQYSVKVSVMDGQTEQSSFSL